MPEIRAGAKRCQFLFATHNANIPILGDAELIAALRADGQAGQGSAVLDPSLIGSIERPEVAHAAEEPLEGGKAAFPTRKEKYNF